MSNKKQKKRAKKISRKSIHYIQLRTHRQWPNQLNYMSHLEVYNSKIKPIIYNIDRLLNNKWIHIRQPQVIHQLNESHQQEIKNYFLHKINLIDYKYFCLNNQFDENNKFIREIFLSSIEITDHLLYLYTEIGNGERHIYEYRLNILKYEFEQERESLKHLFIDQHFYELDNQINILNVIEQEDALKQLIQFKFDKQQLKEKFVKDITMLHVNFKTQIAFLRSTINKIIRSNEQQMNITSKHCHYLHEKTREAKERINQEIKSTYILKRKIKETKTRIEQIDINRNHVNDKLNQLKQCSYYHQ
ncbi:unnamed protein product, partial [Rotaria sordida]